MAAALADDAGVQPAQVPLPAPDQGGPAAFSGIQKASGPGEAAAPAAVNGVPPASPQVPAAQLGHALATVHKTPDGSSQIRILLNPAELGSVQVRITRSHDGGSSVSVAVERPETLRSLQTDLGHLHQALDRAGLPEQRSVVLHLAASDTGQNSVANGQNGSGGQNSAQSGSHQGSRQGGPNGPRPDRATPADAAGQRDISTGWPAATWQRAGVNITA